MTWPFSDREPVKQVETDLVLGLVLGIGIPLLLLLLLLLAALACFCCSKKTATGEWVTPEHHSVDSTHHFTWHTECMTNSIIHIRVFDVFFHFSVLTMIIYQPKNMYILSVKHSWRLERCFLNVCRLVSLDSQWFQVVDQFCRKKRRSIENSKNNNVLLFETITFILMIIILPRYVSILKCAVHNYALLYFIHNHRPFLITHFSMTGHIIHFLIWTIWILSWELSLTNL